MMVTMTHTTALPHSTAECDEGPIVTMKPGHVTIRYDVEGQNEVVWTRLEFSGSVAARFTPDFACDERMVSAYSRVNEEEGSLWVVDLDSAAAANEQTLSASLIHFTVFFDHVGCWEVVADSILVCVE
jgi:hypothetical protein